MGYLVVKNAKFISQVGKIIRTIGVDKIRRYAGIFLFWVWTCVNTYAYVYLYT